MDSRSNAEGIGGIPKGSPETGGAANETVARCGPQAPTWRPKAARLGRSGLNVVAAAG